MISVNSVSMRFGSKILFDDVTTTFSSGRRYAITGPNGAGKSTLMKILTGEIEPEKGTVARPKKMGVLRQDQFAFEVPRDRHRHHGERRLWRRLQERDCSTPRPTTDRRRRHAAGRARRHRRRRGRLHRRKRCRDSARGSGHPGRAARAEDGASCRADRRCASCWRRRCSATPALCCWTSPPTTSTSTPFTGCRIISRDYEARLIVISHDRHFLNEVCTHIADIDYETIITYTGGYDDMVLAKTQIRSRIEADNAQREKKIAQLNEFIARFSAGTRSCQVTVAKKGSGAAADVGAREIEHPAALYPLSDEASVGQAPLEINGSRRPMTTCR